MAAPGMIERRDGSIVIVSSIGGLKGSTVIGAYNISKAADFQLARNLALEWGKHNVRVNRIAPGLVRTDFARGPLGVSADTEGSHDDDASRPHRGAGRDRRCGGVPCLEGQFVHDRPDDRGRRRRDHRWVIRRSCSGGEDPGEDRKPPN